MSAVASALFDILESEAIDKYYLYKEQDKKFAEAPAFLICTGFFAKLGVNSYTVYMGRGLADWTFSKYSEAKAKVLEVISKADPPIKSFQVIHYKGRPKIYDLALNFKNKEGNKL